MKIDDDAMFEFMQDTKGTLGRIEESQRNHIEFTKAVNIKATAIQSALDVHENDQEAHGVKAATAKSHDVVALIGVAFGIIGLIAAFLGHK